MTDQSDHDDDREMDAWDAAKDEEFARNFEEGLDDLFGAGNYEVNGNTIRVTTDKGIVELTQPEKPAPRSLWEQDKDAPTSLMRRAGTNSFITGQASEGWNSPLRLRLNALKMSAVALTGRLAAEGGHTRSVEQVRRYITGVSVPADDIKEQISAIVTMPVPHLWPNAEGYAAPEALGATIPLFGAAEAGFGMDISVMSEPIDQIPALGSLGEDTYAVVVRGESMEPRLEAGDYVYCDPSATFKRGHTVVVQFTDSNGTLRGVVKEFVKRTVGKDRDGHKAWGVTVRQHNPDETYEIQNVQSVSRVVHVKYQ